jgi:WD40 repeat protein
LAIASYKTIKIWDFIPGECIQTLKGHTGSVTFLAVLPENKLASASEDRAIMIWNFISGECIQTLEGHPEWYMAIDRKVNKLNGHISTVTS